MKFFFRNERKSENSVTVTAHEELYDEMLRYFYVENPNISSSDYVARDNRYYRQAHDDVRIIAFYLPQFHSFPENDEWWGKGFTEWTNVTRAVPQYVGQYQPHLPDELGFYDLVYTDDIFSKQVDMARQYGIYGFCFHYYWFSGKRLLEKPLFRFLEDKTLDFPFCLCWANESWSRRWDGSEAELLMPQSFDKNEIEHFYHDIRDFFVDERYIKVEEKPVLIVYRANLFEKELVREALDYWRNLALEDGFKGIYAVCVQSFGLIDNPEEWGFDAAMEFPPHNCTVGQGASVTPFCERFEGDVRDILPNIANIYKDTPPYTLFRTVSPGWDNTARKRERGLSYCGLTPDVYGDWLAKGIRHAKDNCPDNSSFVFVNAWNEWAEGAHLEPDRKYGFSYLAATREALEKYSSIK